MRAESVPVPGVCMVGGGGGSTAQLPPPPPHGKPDSAPRPRPVSLPLPRPGVGAGAQGPRRLVGRGASGGSGDGAPGAALRERPHPPGLPSPRLRWAPGVGPRDTPTAAGPSPPLPIPARGGTWLLPAGGGTMRAGPPKSERRRGHSGGVALWKEGSAGSAPSVTNAVNPSHLCVGEGRGGVP